MSLTSSMNIAQQALLVNEAALNVVSNNISNVNTIGYSRQRVCLSANVNHTSFGGSAYLQAYSGTGVNIDRVERYTDAYLQSYYRQQNSLYNYLNQAANIASNVEDIMNELNGTGLQAAFTSFFEAAQTLNLNPSDISARQNYAQQVQTVAMKFNELGSSLKDARTALVGDVNEFGSLQSSKIYSLTTLANEKLQEIAKANADIVKISSPGMLPSGLLDTRDQLIEELSQLVPVSIVENSNGSVNLSINGIEMIKGSQQTGTLDVVAGSQSEPAIIRVKDLQGEVVYSNINSYLNSGSIGAVIDMASEEGDVLTIKSTMKNLDKLAKGFSDIINRIQTQVIDGKTSLAIDKDTMLLTDATENIFESSDGEEINALNIRVNSDILEDPYLIAAARLDKTDPNYSAGAIGNNSNMLMVLDVRTNGSSELDNFSPESFLSQMVGDIGLKTASINSSLKSQSAVLSQVSSQLSSATGVNINEEVIDLTKYQAAYQASARVYSVCNDLLDVLLNLGR
ncbi:MAG TPA: flagellar hook-associated protein FlgK [Candidatus Gastranaerophilaceae bacterium]|nr:flagellar hook-associated protein FlgK [Candidatus Gastranaerophilaceae bacterium]HPT41910.1 flagellar hook-associated protein FlgK [Candidatus Gastranaerophilaceae bacterium]